MVRMTVRCKRELFSVDDLKRLSLSDFHTKLKTPNSSNITMIDERTIPDAAHFRRHGRLGLYGLQFSITGP